MKKEELVATRLPRSLVLDLKKIEDTEQSDRSTVLRKLLHSAVADWKKEHAARLYADGKVSLERAAMDSRASVRKMMEHLKARKIPAQYDVEDLERGREKLLQESGALTLHRPHVRRRLPNSCVSAEITVLLEG